MSIVKPIAVITGASSGLGKDMSIELARRGYNIILISRSEYKLKEVQQIIKKNNNQSKIYVVDISKENTIDDFFSKIINRQNIDILINNAGIMKLNNIENISTKEWDDQINVNLRGSFLMTKKIVPLMIKRKSGKIVFINSVAGINPYPNGSAYVASKYAMRGFASSIREELREHNIKVISVHPGSIDTPLWDSIDIDFKREEMMSSRDVSISIIDAVLAPNNLVQEEIIIRRTAGDI